MAIAGDSARAPPGKGGRLKSALCSMLSAGEGEPRCMRCGDER